MQNENIILTATELEAVTGGYWENLPAQGINIKFINYRRAGVKAGDLHVSLDKIVWSKDRNRDSVLEKIFAKGAVAVVIRKDVHINTDKPILRVENTKKALKSIAKASRRATKATKVLVTGSVGKTGFKTQLYHLLHNQFPTNAVLNSANKNVPIWRALSCIRTNDQVAIIEVAVPKAGRGKKRARWVRPDICVITDIGLEHITAHGGKLENVIINKAEVAKGLQPGGKFIIPDKKGITDKLRQEISRHGDFEIFLFGEDDSCNGQLLSQKFTGFGWDIKARIEDKIIEYRLPLLEEYAPLSSISVLLTAYHLGADIDKSVLEYNDYQQYDSSGNFFKLKNSKGNFYLYDQSKRGEMDAFKSTLRLISRMEPAEGGRKIAILSEFTNFEEADKSIINIKEFSELIDRSGIDLLYTTHYFTEHIKVLTDKSIWKNHSIDIENIIPEILQSIGNNDIVFVRGTLKSNLKEIVQQIFKSCEILKKYN
ncbi:MAG: Mur ligase family protein [Methylococcaceae bacterium]